MKLVTGINLSSIFQLFALIAVKRPASAQPNHSHQLAGFGTRIISKSAGIPATTIATVELTIVHLGAMNQRNIAIIHPMVAISSTIPNAQTPFEKRIPITDIDPKVYAAGSHGLLFFAEIEPASMSPSNIAHKIQVTIFCGMFRINNAIANPITVEHPMSAPIGPKCSRFTLPPFLLCYK